MTPDFSDIAKVLPGVFLSFARSPKGSFELLFADGTVLGKAVRPAGDMNIYMASFLKGLGSRERRKLFRTLLRSRARREKFEITFVWTAEGGCEHWFSLSACPSVAEDGSTHWSGLLLDVTDKKAAEIEAAERLADFETLFMNAPENIIRYDLDGRVLSYNSQLRETLGVGPDELVGILAEDIQSSFDFSNLIQAVRDVAKTGEARTVEVKLPPWPGRAVEFHVVNLVAERDGSGQIKGVLGFGRNIAELDVVQAALAESQGQLRAAIKIFPDMVWMKDTENRYVLCNDQFEAFNRVKEGALIGKQSTDVPMGKGTSIHTRTDEEALRTKKVVQFDFETACLGQPEPRFFDVRKIAIENIEGDIVGILGTARDVTEKRKLEEEVRDRERAYRSLAENMPDSLVRYGPDGSVQYANSAMDAVFNRFFGTAEWGKSAIHGGVLADESSGGSTLKRALEVFQTGLPMRFEQMLESPGGKKLFQEIRLVPEFASDGTVETVLSIGRDITAWKDVEAQLKANERQLEDLAYNDSLTGLANRITFRRELCEWIAQVSAHGGKIALLTLDIDRFKSVNDTLGHLCGDQLLIEFAGRLTKTVGNRGRVARLGGDEFVVILPHVSGRADALQVANDIAYNVSQPMRIRGNHIAITTSVGISIGPDDSLAEDELFRFSDIALYHAKSSGRSRACCFSREMRDEFENRFEMERLITDGLKEGQFSAHFQAKVDLRTHDINGVEALCRWRHPERGMISPDEFIPVAEDTGQILELGKLVLTEACQFAVACNSGRQTPIPVAVNVSARQLSFGGFLGTLGDCLEQTGCKAAWIELELTESTLLADDLAAEETLSAISALGIRLTIDDFGTGYSSLSYLGRFPITSLKIDQSFVRKMDTDPKQEVLVKAIIAIAHGLGLQTVAEGIEDRDAADKLLAFGCEAGQGYYFYRPVPADVLLETLSGKLQLSM